MMSSIGYAQSTMDKQLIDSMVERSVMFQPDGKIVEYDKIVSTPINKLASGITNRLEQQRQLQDDVPVVVITNEIAPMSSVIVDQHQNSEMEWSSFLLIFAIFCLALYSIRILVQRVRELRSNYKENSNQFVSSNNRSGLLADMDEEWRMQKLDSDAPTKRLIEQPEGNYNRIVEQQWPSYQIGKRTEPKQTVVEASFPPKKVFIASTKKSARFSDDEFKRS